MSLGGPLRVAVTALGCKVNHAEMADLAGRLAAAGCEVVSEDQPADVRVLNSCTVTMQADATTRQRLRRIRRDDPGAHLVLTGCSVDGNPATYLATDPDGARLLPPGVDAVFANAEKENIADHVIGLAVQLGAAGVGLPVPSRSRAFIKVQDGCNHRCTYCSVWRARGASRTVPIDDVVALARAAVDAGHAEVVLTGVDLGSYGRGRGTSLACLVGTLLDSVPGARFRLSSVNTNDVTDELLALNAHPQLCSHWHMPLQSGSDAVLRAMHRGYRRAQYLRVCAQLRELDSDTEFTSDVMVGFPGETDEDHDATLGLITEVAMLDVHAFRYSPRPGTPASALPAQVTDGAARRRSLAVRRAAGLSGRQRRLRALGRVHDVVWDRVGDTTAHGLTSTYLEVCAPAGPGVTGGGRATLVADRLDGDVLHGAVTRR